MGTTVKSTFKTLAAVNVKDRVEKKQMVEQVM